MPPLDLSKLDLRDALDLAILIEEEAQERYAAFTRIVGGRYAGDATEVFRRMAVNEEKHGTQLGELRKAIFADAPRRVSRDQVDSVEAPDWGRVRVTLSARRAMEIAIESETKAWEFFAEACRVAEDPKVRRLFMDLREEEREHKEMLQRRLPDFPPEPAVDEDPGEEAGSDPG